MYYSKVLVPGDISDRLTVPEKWMEILGHLFAEGQSEASLRVVDWSGYGHYLRVAIRKRGPHRKPVLQSQEWKMFVAYAGLQPGDEIVIYQLEGAHFRGATHGVDARRLNSDGIWAELPTPQGAVGSDPDLLPFF